MIGFDKILEDLAAMVGVDRPRPERRHRRGRYLDLEKFLRYIFDCGITLNTTGDARSPWSWRMWGVRLVRGAWGKIDRASSGDRANGSNGMGQGGEREQASGWLPGRPPHSHSSPLTPPSLPADEESVRGTMVHTLV